MPRVRGAKHATCPLKREVKADLVTFDSLLTNRSLHVLKRWTSTSIALPRACASAWVPAPKIVRSYGDDDAVDEAVGQQRLSPAPLKLKWRPSA